jgi:cytochrome oxidase Cu insertion factor (SCO1/SenC/PrrC family)/thiol-disulfide isomerase/thioredoxin
VSRTGSHAVTAMRRRARPARPGLRLQALCLALALALALAVSLGGVAPPTRADGDPGSDVLVYQSLFLAPDAGVSVPEQVRLAALLQSAARHGMPIRVALIATPADLGAVVGLWQQPRAYARFLGLELSLAYKGRLLVVMPDGFGLNWPGHPSAAAYGVLSHVKVGRGGPGLAVAAAAAVRALASADHVALGGSPAPQAGGRPTHASRAASPGGASDTQRVLVFIALAAIALAIIALRLAWPRRRTLLARAPGLLRLLRPRLAIPLSLTVLGCALLALLLSAGPRASPTKIMLDANPLLDPGTPLSGRARDFTLYDQFGRLTSLSSFRGKVVMLAFNDSECTSVCPLTTQAMLDAKAMLGPAGERVQLLGVDANPRATAVEDVASYSELHGMLHAWRFLTGNLASLKRVWKAYSIGVSPISERLVDHTPAIFIIDPQGRLRRLYVTQQSYATVPQLGQVLAAEAAALLPGHPRVNSQLSYARIPGISPGAAVTLPTAAGGSLTLGPGRARLLVFFASWDRQITGLPVGLEELSAYARAAAHDGLPSLSAVDEAAVEPTGALQSFLRSLPRPLPYPVALDTSGRLADGYEVQGLPWLVLTTASGRIAWYQAVDNDGWPAPSRLRAEVRAALARVPKGAAEPAQSPPALSALHAQGSRLLIGGRQLLARLRALRGYPVVLNVWASWCGPCKAEFGLLASAAARYGSRVAFLGADFNDSPADARSFLQQHPISYPSYNVQPGDLSSLVALEGTPTTIYLNRKGRVVWVHTGQYDTQGALDGDVETYALSSG